MHLTYLSSMCVCVPGEVGVVATGFNYHIVLVITADFDTTPLPDDPTTISSHLCPETNNKKYKPTS